MQQDILSIFPLLAPLSLLVFAFIITMKYWQNLNRQRLLVGAVGFTGILVFTLSAMMVYRMGTIQSPLLGIADLGFSLRLDALSMLMSTMIALLGLVILRFSTNYLEGDARKGIFFRRLAITIASVEFLVLSGNIFQLMVFWVITSFCLHYLLTFYKDRPQAIGAARKKFIVARIGDFSLLIATGLIYFDLGTGNLTTIFVKVQEMEVLSTALTWSTILLVIAAIFKSAQFPTHGWLIEVVETPTPVSALLHAGLLNAGPFLMVRMGYLMIESTSASMVLIIVGGFTALFASVVYLTQPSIKISLGYSSVAHMGFSLLICGFGVYTAAILHVVAHSFYKAHSFLSSGSVIDNVRSQKVMKNLRKGSFLRIVIGILLALGVYLTTCLLWGINPDQHFSLMAIGSIIVMGISQVMVTTIDSKGSLATMLTAMGIAFGVAASFFTLEHGASILLESQLPIDAQPSSTIRGLMIAVLGVYGLVTLIQLYGPVVSQTRIGYQLGVHLRNGLYVNVLFDRMIGSLKNEKFRWVNLTVQEEQNHMRDYSKEAVGSKEKVLLNN